jgi:hypothetical protein
MSTRFLVIFAAAVSHVAVAAEPPTIDRLIPMGGQRGSTFEIRFTGKAGDGDLRILSEQDCINFVLSEKRDSATITIASTARSGLHWVRFINPSGATELRPFVVGLIPEIAESEPNARIAEAQEISLPSTTINGVLDKSKDVDTFAVQLMKGQTLVASMQAHQILGSPMDAVLQIVSEKGAVVAQNDDDTGFDPRLTFIAPSDGKWFVRTFAFPATPNSTIAFASGADFVYRLTLTTEPVVEQTLPAVRFSGDPETTFTLHGCNLSTTTATLTGDQSTLEVGLALPFPVGACDIPVALESQLPADRTLSIPIAVSGTVSAGDTDSYMVNAAKSQQLSLLVQARAIGSLLDPVLTVYDKDGKQLKEADDISGENSDAEIQLTIPADGPYRITVQDRFQNSGDRYFYVLRCEETRPIFVASVKSTALVLSADKPLEIPMSLDRRHGFAEPVDFRVEGLPEGICAECPRSEKDGDSSKAVTLKLSGTVAELFQGPVRVIAESVDSKQQQPVSSSLADGSTVTELWLTIPATMPAPATTAAPVPEE